MVRIVVSAALSTRTSTANAAFVYRPMNCSMIGVASEVIMKFAFVVACPGGNCLQWGYLLSKKYLGSVVLDQYQYIPRTSSHQINHAPVHLAIYPSNNPSKQARKKPSTQASQQGTKQQIHTPTPTPSQTSTQPASQSLAVYLASQSPTESKANY